MSNFDKNFNIIASGCGALLFACVLGLLFYIIFSDYFPKYSLLITAIIWFVIFFYFSVYFKRKFKQEDIVNEKMIRDLELLAAKFGKNPTVKAEGFSFIIYFEIDTVIFESVLTSAIWLDNSTVMTLRFHFPVSEIREVFFIERRGEVFPNIKGIFSKTSDCQRYSFSELDEKYHFNCSNPQFLTKVLQEENLKKGLSEIHERYKNKVRFYLDNGEFFADCSFWASQDTKDAYAESLVVLEMIANHSLDYYRAFQRLNLIGSQK